MPPVSSADQSGNEQNSQHDRALAMYAAASRPIGSLFGRTLLLVWTVIGLTLLVWVALAEPFSARLFVWAGSLGLPSWICDYIGVPVVMMLRGVLMLETSGYAYHRFCQHIGWMTRRWSVIRRNQRIHWTHHMKIYPYGPEYQREAKYIPAEEGIGLSWAAPFLLIAALLVVFMGANLGTLVFILSMAVFAKLVVDTAHSRFHETEHSLGGWRYFRWLSEIHILHHWDQRYNFTIWAPVMDILFGTYLSPKRYRWAVEECARGGALTLSDLQNWLILLREAHPEEYGAIVSDARGHRPSRAKLDQVSQVLQRWVGQHPQDSEAEELLRRAERLKMLANAPATK